ncbi:alpha-N-acetylglucosamine transferase [Rothia mucilaginosa]|uniref:Alpha-N-acetylglucosamine transferase n=1 Tax=Rothia mucilaginosa TaxID=43675 RepID=A0A943TCW5_9MICC|nr:alpha-N-acetylglucosamine transferase [Rothia mucilaginosa]MBS6634580.1 alpha-N-acetylglucosamine transferase [Rothia mucilaginosa]
MTPRPFSVLYAFILTEVFAAYLLIRGVLYPILLSHGEPAQGIVGGVLQILIAAGMTFYALRFYRGRYGSRLPMILMTLCALWVTASTLVQSVSTYGVSIEGFNPLIVAGVIGAAVAFIFVLLPSSRRYIEAVTEERGEEANRHGRRR